MARIPDVIFEQQFTADHHCGWFRLFGVGVAWIDSGLYGELLSRRYVGQRGWKDRRQLRLGSWRFAITTRRNP